MKAKLLLFTTLCLPGVSAAQTMDKQKVELFAAAAVAHGINVNAVQRPQQKKSVYSSISQETQQTPIPTLPFSNHSSPKTLAGRQSRKIQGSTKTTKKTSSLSPENESRRVRYQIATSTKSLRPMQAAIYQKQSTSRRSLPQNQTKPWVVAQQMQHCNRAPRRIGQTVLTSSPVSAEVERFAHAIALAEGFGPKTHLPTRYHNPGDIKSNRKFTKLPGQKSIGKGGHIVFRDDAAGWSALADLLTKMVDGRSRHFNADMTVSQVARHYAGNWRPWVKIVTKELGVESDAKLRDLLLEPEPPTITLTPAPFVLQIDPVLPTLAQDKNL